MQNKLVTTSQHVEWIKNTVSELEEKGYRLIPHYPNGKLAPHSFKDGQFYPSDDPAWQTSPLISIALDDLLLLDYDGNKSNDILSIDSLANKLILSETALMASCVQSNHDKNSLHFLFRRGCAIDKLNQSNDGWLPFIDIKTGNQLMHLKPGKTLALPSLNELKIAPEVLIEALRKPQLNSLSEAKNDPLFEPAQWLHNIDNNETFHSSNLHLSAHLISRGVAPQLVTELLQMVFKSKEHEQLNQSDKDRFWERYNDIPRLVEGAVAKGFNQQVFNKPGHLGKGWLDIKESPPRILINDLMPSNVFGFVGAGGAAKTTLLLKIMVHITLGIPVWGRPINYVGKCLFVSAEDDLSTIKYRLQKIVDAMWLTDIDKQTVEDSLFIHDISGDMIRFVEADKNGNLSLTHHVDDIIDIYRDKGLEFVCFDPAVFFGPGERYVNDAEAALMQCARRISNGLGGITTGYIHHMSKAAAADKDTSIHAGRGGSAFGDNARCLWVLHKYDPNDKNDKKITPPSAIDRSALSDGRVGRLTISKFSLGVHKPGPFWMVRSEHNGFDIDLLESTEHTPEQVTAQLNKEEQDLKRRRMKALFEAIKEAFMADRPHSASSLKSAGISAINGGLVPRSRISALIEEMVRLNIIIKVKDEQDGRKIRLQPAPDDELRQSHVEWLNELI